MPIINALNNHKLFINRFAIKIFICLVCVVNVHAILCLIWLVWFGLLIDMWIRWMFIGIMEYIRIISILAWFAKFHICRGIMVMKFVNCFWSHDENFLKNCNGFLKFEFSANFSWWPPKHFPPFMQHLSTLISA